MTYALSQIPNLPPAVALNGSELIEAVQGGTSVRVTISQLTQIAVSAIQASTVIVNPSVAGWNNVQDAVTGLNQSKVARAGDTMTGDLTILKAAPAVNLNANSGVFSHINGQVAGVTEWQIELNGGAGGSTHAFAINAFDTSGNPLGFTVALYKDWPGAEFNIQWMGIHQPVGIGGAAEIDLSAQPGSLALLSGQKGNYVDRWHLILGDDSAETGSNTGSNYRIDRFSDGGAYIDTVYSISRQSGVANFTYIPTIPTTTPTSSNQVASKQYVDLAVSGGAATQAAHMVYAGPASGSPALPTWRGLLAADTPQSFPTAGGTITGPVTLTPGAGAISFYLNKSASGFANFITGQTAASTRWQIAMGDATTESSTSTGSDFSIARYSNAGGFMDTPLFIARATGVAAFNQIPTIPTTAPTTSNQVTSKNYTDATYLPLAGGAMTGPFTSDVTISKTSPTLVLNKPAVGTNTQISSQDNGLGRWSIVLADNASDNFAINPYNDAGVQLASALTINRANSIAVFGAIPQIPTSAPVSPAQVTSKNYVDSLLTGSAASQTANTFFAAPNGSAGAPTFRLILAADLPATLTPTTVQPTAGNLTINAGAAGSNVALGRAGTNDWNINGASTGAFTPTADNQRDIGTATLRVKTIYAVNVGSTAAPLTGAWSATFVAMGTGPSIQINKTASTQTARLIGQTNSSVRWTEYLGDGTAESGSNVGSDYKLERYADGGTAIDVPLTITRSTGVATFTQIPQIPTTAPTLAAQATSKSFTDATYLPLAGGTLTGATTISSGNLVIQNGGIINSSATAQMELGSTAASNAPYIDWHSSGNAIDYDVRLQASGGSASVGAGTLTFTGGTLQVNAAANVTGILTLSNQLIENSGAANAVLNLNSTGAFQDVILFNNGGVNKWQLGKQTDDTVFFYDGAAASSVWTCATGAAFTVQRALQVNGAINSTGSTAVNSGAANASVTVNSTGAFQSSVFLNNGGVTKWQIGKQSNDNFFIYDTAGASNFITAGTNLGGVNINRNTTFNNGAAADINVVLNKGAAGYSNLLLGQTNGSTRWRMILGDNVAEGGSNAGSNLLVQRYADAGTLIDTPLTITRSTGIVTFGQNPIVTTASGATTFTLNKAASGVPNALYGQMAGNNRWSVVVGNNAPESGSNTGSDFSINRFNDAGTQLDSPIIIDRAAGNVTVANSLVVNGSITQSGGTPGPAGFRNKLINGDFRLNQYNATNAVNPSATGATYVTDRWFYSTSQTLKYSFQTNAGGPNNFAFYERCFVSNAYTALATDSFAFAQAIEATNLEDLQWGTAGAQSVTLSFWARSTQTGTFSGALKARSANRAYPFTFAMGTANTWAKYTVTVPGDTLVSSTNWPVGDTSVGLYVIFNLGCGSNFLGTAGAWVSSSNLNGVTGSVNLVATASASLDLAGIQLEIGTVGTAYEVRPYGLELSLCERYFQSSYDPGVVPGTVSNNGAQGHVLEAAASFPSIQLPFRTSMRAVPTVTLYSPNTGAAGKIYDQNTPQDVAGTLGMLGMRGTTALVNSVSIAVGHSIYVHYTAAAEL